MSASALTLLPRAGTALALGLALLGCPKAGVEGQGEGAGGREPASDEGRLEGTCGTSGLTFSDHAWVPADATLLTSIRRDDPELEAALERLARRFSEPVSKPGFVTAGWAYRHLGPTVANVERLLAEIGLDPGELVQVQGPEVLAWVLPTDCAPAELATRVSSRWQLMLTADFGRAGIRVGQGEELPFDVIVIDDTRVVLTLPGQASAAVAWLHPSGGREGPGRLLGRIAPAAVRGVVSPPTLLSLDAGPTVQRTTVRATATEVELDDSPTPSPEPQP